MITHTFVRITLLNKLFYKDLVCSTPKIKFTDNKICDACIKSKQIRSLFQWKKKISTTRTLELLYMDLCGPVKIQSRGITTYILVIVDDFISFTQTIFLKSKDEIFELLIIFVKQIQVKLSNKIARNKYDHGIEVENSKVEEFFFFQKMDYVASFPLPKILSKMLW